MNTKLETIDKILIAMFISGFIGLAIFLVNMGLGHQSATPRIVYELRSEHPNGARNVLAGYYDPRHCNEAKYDRIRFHPEVNFRCVEVERTDVN